jgi:hypothetical protein
MSDSGKNILTFIIAIRNFLEDLDDNHLNSLLADWPPADGRTRSVAPHTLPVISWLPEAVKAAGKKAESVVKRLAALANQIAWNQTYSAEDFGAEFLESYGWTEFIGLRGPIASNRIACGFLILGPQIEYPRHSHEAEEVYVPLTGQTLWLQSNQGWVYRAPCLPIYHTPRMPHAMRTESVPLLALYLWRGGNLTEKSN